MSAVAVKAKRRLTWRGLAFVGVALAVGGCGGGGGSTGAGTSSADSPPVSGADTTRPTVTAITPANAAQGVSATAVISVTFSEAVAEGTVTAATFTVTPEGGTAVAATVSASGSGATLTPAAPLAYATAYTVSLTSGITDRAGNSLVPHQSGFRTAEGPDLTAPRVTRIVPANGAEDVAVGQPVRVTFSEAVSFSALDETVFQVGSEAGTVPGTVSYDSATGTAVFTASGLLGYSTRYTVSLGAGVTDAAGNTLESFTSYFTTVGAPDLTAPEVIARNPDTDAAGVALDTVITATFSEPMNAATVTTATFQVNNGEVAGTVFYSEVSGFPIATFTPSAGLALGTSYTVTLTTDIKDLAGNALAAPVSWRFTTVAGDTRAPAVISTLPANGALSVPAGLAAVQAVFSEGLDPATVSAETFFLMDAAGRPAGGTVSYDVAGRTAIFTPGALSTETVYTATLTTGITDLAGNRLAADYTWTFTTAAAEEVIAPGVTQTVQPDGSTQVGVDLNGLTATEIADALTALQGLLDGTLTTSGPLNITMTGDPDNPLALEVPLIITRSDVNITVTPSGTITLDGSGVLDPDTGEPISNIVEIGGSNVTLDGINVVNGQVDLITQPGGAKSGVVLKNLVLHDAVTDDCINLRDCTDCRIENVQAYRCFKKGLQLTGVTNITVRDVRIGFEEPVAEAIACDPDTDGTCPFGSNSPRAFVEIFKSNGGRFENLTINSSRAGSAGTGQAAPDGSAAFGNGILLNQSSGDFTFRGVTIHHSAMADTGATPHGVISVWQHATPSTILIEDARIENNPFKAFSFAKKSGVEVTINVTGSTVSGNSGGLIEVMNGPVSCTFSGSTLDGDPSAFCAVVP